MYIPFERYELPLAKSVITALNESVDQSSPFNVSFICQSVSAAIVIQQSGLEISEKAIITFDAFCKSSAETNSSSEPVKVFLLFAETLVC